ncbi:GAD-like domain-containing protein [Vannielia litorea]|uniref:GAD-like domain-containing protein n=1 Tax=Vannielia litorea TaxID=1217970 RepID=UPI001C986289|nr:GAD-like domain-containing protein [Vannielia litorea]MBY6047002.1 DUF1851 domain-containing protein [Vannielia litorea]MBY6074416.1 DUF1851 domain-containing protein [Vannielia litorea]
MLHSHYAEMIEEIGPPRGGKAPSAEAMDYLRAHLPAAYVGFIEEFGFGHYFDRGYQFCDPLAFRPVVALIFKADSDFSHADCHVVAYNAWGTLKMWSERHGEVTVDLLRYTVKAPRLLPNVMNAPILPAGMAGTATEPDANSLSAALLPWDDNARELWDFADEPMFREAVRRLGPLQAGECFGFVPSLAVAGYDSRTRAVENVQKMDALVHFTMIAQLAPFALTHLVHGRETIAREIG